MNNGKKFEKSFQDSCNKRHICCVRLVDSNKFGDHTQSRFTPDNIADFICHYNNSMYILELKHTQNTSISFNQPCDKKGNGTYMIKPKQVQSLLKYTGYENVHVGLLVDFADRETKTRTIKGGTYYIDIEIFKGWADIVGKKSMNIEDAKVIGIPVDRHIKITNYDLDVEKLFSDVANTFCVSNTV